MKQKCSKRCDKLMNVLKLLTNQEKDGDSPIESIVRGVREKSRKGVIEELRHFIEVDNHNAVDVGGLRRGTKSIQVNRCSRCLSRGGYQRRRRRIDLASCRSGFIANLH